MKFSNKESTIYKKILNHLIIVQENIKPFGEITMKYFA